MRFEKKNLPQANVCIIVISNTNWHAFISRIQAVISSTKMSHQIRYCFINSKEFILHKNGDIHTRSSFSCMAISSDMICLRETFWVWAFQWSMKGKISDVVAFLVCMSLDELESQFIFFFCILLSTFWDNSISESFISICWISAEPSKAIKTRWQNNY